MKWRASRSQPWFETWLQSVPVWMVVTISVLLLSGLKVLVEVEGVSLLPSSTMSSMGEQIIKVLLQDVESIAAVVAVILYVRGFPERRAQRHYNAWRTIDMAAANRMSVSYARYEALQELHRDGLSLQGVEAPGANLVEIELAQAELSQCNLSGANLQNANLREADLRDSNLRNANLTGANLVGANLVGSDLTGAILRNAELWDAKLWDANLTDAELRWAELHDQDLKGAKLSRTVMPDGYQTN